MGDIYCMKFWLKDQYGGHPNWKAKVDKMSDAQVFAVYCRLRELEQRNVDTYIHEHGDFGKLECTRYRFVCPLCGCDFEIDKESAEREYPTIFADDEPIEYIGVGHPCPECGNICRNFKEVVYRV